MSWDAAQPGVILNAALIGKDASLWGATENDGFQISQQEIDNIVNGFANKGYDFFESGINVAGIKYLATKVELPPSFPDGRSVYGRKGATGVVMAGSGTAIVLAVYKDDAAHTAVAVEKLADYLVGQGY